jgi:hypothetical protein
MSQPEVEVKPYGTKNELETRVYSSGSANRAEGDSVKPPYGQKNETVGSAPPSSGFNIGGSRADVEVKPYGTQDVGLNKPQRVATTTTVRPLSNEQWRNPLMATLLGITLALTLLSLSYLPRAISGLWHWGTHWGHSTPSDLQSKTYDAYDSVTRGYPQELAKEKDRVYQQGKDMYDQGKNMYEQRKDQMYRATVDTVESARDKAAGMVNNVKESMETPRDSLYDRAKQTGENILHAAKETIYPSSGTSMTQEAKRVACQTAQKARDTACEGVNMGGSWRGMDAMESARDAAYNEAQQAAGVFEQAKQRASDILEHAKDTVTYPLYAAKEAAAATGERIQAARDNVIHTGEAAKDRVEGTAAQTVQAAKDTLQGAQDTLTNAGQAAKDTVLGAGQAAKDTVVGAGQAAKDTVVGAGQAAKDTVVGAGQAAKDMASNTLHGMKDTVTGATNSKDDNRGPTRVKVEVQEL